MSEFSVRRPVTVLMICIGIMVLGYISATRIPVQLLPEVVSSELSIISQFKGATPEEVETLVTTPIERAISTVSGLNKSESTSERERSEIRLTFKNGIDFLETVSVLREKLDSVSLPDGSAKPRIVRYQANSEPILRIAIKKKDESKSMYAVSQMLREVLLRKLESVDGIALAILYGAPSKSLNIIVDPVAVQSFGLSMSQIPSLIQGKNKSFPGGDIEYQGKRTSIRLGESIKSLDELAGLTIIREQTKTLRLGDISKIEVVLNKPEIRTHIRGDDALIIDIKKEAEANTVEVSKLAKEILTEFFEEYASDLEGVLVVDQGREIKMAIDGVSEAVLHGGILTCLLIYVFMQALWPTFVITVTIPLALFITFILMYFTGVSFNLMSLAGLALGVGMLTDRSIVVLSNINYFQTQLDDPKEAAVWGTNKVSAACFGGTLTNIAVFGPLIFVEGSIGQIFRDISLAVVFSDIAALIVALLVIPVLTCINFGGGSPKGQSGFGWSTFIAASIASPQFDHQSILSGAKITISRYFHFFGLGLKLILSVATFSVGRIRPYLKVLFEIINSRILIPIQTFFARILAKLENDFAKWLPMILEKHGKRASIATAILMIISIGVFANKGAELFPDAGSQRFVFNLEYPPGQTLDLTENKIRSVEATLVKLEGAIHVASIIGEKGSNVAKIIVTCPEKYGETMDRSIGTILQQFPDLAFSRVKDNVVGEGKPLQIEIYNDDLGKLKSQVTLGLATLGKLPGLTDIESDIKPDVN